MLILEPTAGDKTITIAPRSALLGGVIVMKIRRDGDGKEELITSPAIGAISNFTVITFQSTILQEDATYYLEITRNSELWYRDKIYVTSQTSTERETNKHQIGNATTYKPYSDSDDNKYII
tara:strand:- start:741 stop:1103 length:363 start_codon:yes stop_codon:yes gene_type:complete